MQNTEGFSVEKNTIKSHHLLSQFRRQLDEVARVSVGKQLEEKREEVLAELSSKADLFLSRFPNEDVDMDKNVVKLYAFLDTFYVEYRMLLYSAVQAVNRKKALSTIESFNEKGIFSNFKDGKTPKPSYHYPGEENKGEVHDG